MSKQNDLQHAREQLRDAGSDILALANSVLGQSNAFSTDLGTINSALNSMHAAIDYLIDAVEECATDGDLSSLRDEVESIRDSRE